MKAERPSRTPAMIGKMGVAACMAAMVNNAPPTVPHAAPLAWPIDAQATQLVVFAERGDAEHAGEKIDLKKMCRSYRDGHVEDFVRAVRAGYIQAIVTPLVTDIFAADDLQLAATMMFKVSDAPGDRGRIREATVTINPADCSVSSDLL